MLQNWHNTVFVFYYQADGTWYLLLTKGRPNQYWYQVVMHKNCTTFACQKVLDIDIKEKFHFLDQLQFIQASKLEFLKLGDEHGFVLTCISLYLILADIKDSSNASWNFLAKSILDSKRYFPGLIIRPQKVDATNVRARVSVHAINVSMI